MMLGEYFESTRTRKMKPLWVKHQTRWREVKKGKYKRISTNIETEVGKVRERGER